MRIIIEVPDQTGNRAQGNGPTPVDVSLEDSSSQVPRAMNGGAAPLDGSGVAVAAELTELAQSAGPAEAANPPNATGAQETSVPTESANDGGPAPKL